MVPLLTLRIPDLFVPDDLVARPLHLDPDRPGMSIVAERRLVRKDGADSTRRRASKVLLGRMQQASRDPRPPGDAGAAPPRRPDGAFPASSRPASRPRSTTPLAYTALNIEHAQRALRGLYPAPPTLARALADASDGVERVRVIVRDAFGRGRSRLSAVDVNRALDAALRIADSKIRHRARLVKQYETTTPVHANELRLGHSS